MAIIGSFLLSKGKDFAIGKATSYAKGKVIDETKKRVANAVFGKAIGETGEVSDQTDFRGRIMYKEVKPTKIVALFCGGSVIDTRDLDERLRDQAIQAFDLNANTSLTASIKRNEDGEQTVPEGTIVLTGDETSDDDLKTYGGLSEEEKFRIGQKDEDAQPEPPPLTENDVKVEENVNKPITLEDFERQVTWEKPNEKKAKNKGYVRFAKVAGKDGAFGVKLEKVGNKCGWFMSWRTNVTKEHNRQMRLLFADTLLADFGGVDGIDGTDNSQYGAVLTERLSTIRTRILNGMEPGKMLARTTVRKCIEDYRAIFETAETRNEIVNSFLEECLKQCAFTMPSKNRPSVADFLEAYGKHAGAGFQTPDDLEKLFAAVTNGKELRAAMAKVADAFGRMNEAWQIDKSAATVLGDIKTNQTTANDGLPTGKALERLKKAIVRRLGDHTEDKGNDYRDVNLFFEKAFGMLVRSARVTWGTNLDAPNRDATFRAALTLDSIVTQVKAFTENVHDIEREIAEKENPLDLVIEIKQKEKDGIDEQLGRLAQSGKRDEDLSSKSIDLDRQIGYLKDIRNKASGETALMSEGLKERLQNLDLKVEKADLKDEAKQALAKERQTLTLDSLTTMIVDASRQIVSKDFARGFALDRCMRAQFPNLADEQDLRAGESRLDDVFSGLDKLRSDLDRRISAFEESINIALAANLKDKGDIPLQDLIAGLADHLLSEIGVDKLGNASSAAMNQGDPRFNPANRRQNSEQMFIQDFVEAAVKSAINQKVKSGVPLTASLEMFKADSKKLVDLIAGLFGKLSANENYGGLKAFFRSVNTFSMHNQKAVDKESVHVLNNAYATGLREMLHLKLIGPFMEDVTELMAEESNLDKFGKLAGVKFNLRVNEMVSSFRQTMEHQFYEGHLGFTTSHDENKVHEEALASVTDPKTGYTNPEHVAKAFALAFGTFDVTGVLNGTVELGGKTFNRPACLRDARTDNLAGYLNAHAPDLWRSLVVANAPGRSFVYALDWLKDTVLDLFGVTTENRFKDITPAWRERVMKKFGSAFTRYIRDYVAFENRLVDLFRNEISKALNEGKDSRFANVSDIGKQKQLLEDVLGGYLDRIEGVLQRYAATPDAFEKLGNGDLARLVRDSLGLEKRGAGTDIVQTSGYARVADLLGKAIVNRQDLINAYITVGVHARADGVKIGLEHDVATRILERIQASRGRSGFLADGIFASKLVTRVAKYAIDFAKDHPVDAFESTYEALAEKLVDKAMLVMEKVLDTFETSRAALTGKLQETLKGISKDDVPAWVQNRANDERLAVLDQFVDTLFNLAVSGSTKSEAGFGESVAGLVGDLSNGFSAYVENLKAMKIELSNDVYRAVNASFTENFGNGQALLVAHGAAPNVLVQFIHDVQGVWAELPNLVEEVEKKEQELLRNSEGGSYNVNGLKVQVAEKLLAKQKALTETYLRLLDDNRTQFTGCGIANELARHGVDAEAFPDSEIFESIVASYLKDSGAVNAYEGIQFNAILKERQTGNTAIGLDMTEVRIGSMTAEQFEKDVDDFWSKTAANFRLQYSILTAQKRVRGEIEAQKAQIADLAKGNAWEQETVDNVVARSVGALEAKLAALGRIDVRLMNDANVNLVEFARVEQDGQTIVAIKDEDFQKSKGVEVERFKSGEFASTREDPDSKGTFITDYALDNLKVDLVGDVRRAFEAEDWLKKNLGTIANRVMQLESKSFTFDPDHWGDKALKDLATLNRTRVMGLIQKGLMNGALLSGGAADWDNAFKDVLEGGKVLPFSDMLDRIHGELAAEIKHMRAVMDSRATVFLAMSKEVAMVTDLCNKAFLTWCMPSSMYSPRSGSKVPGSYYYEKLMDFASGKGLKSAYESPTYVYERMKDAQKSNEAVARLFGPGGYDAALTEIQGKIKSELEKNIKLKEDGLFTYTAYEPNAMREDANGFLQRVTGLSDPMKAKNKDVTTAFKKFVDGLGR